MSDLISRSEAMENYCNALCPKLQKGEYCNNCIVKAWLNNQPTAFDIDRVVEELEENASRYTKKYVTPYGNNGYRDTKAISIHKAIEIVKHGGVIEAEQKLKEMESK